jgi:hypothetical protein
MTDLNTAGPSRPALSEVNVQVGVQVDGCVVKSMPSQRVDRHIRCASRHPQKGVRGRVGPAG